LGGLKKVTGKGRRIQGLDFSFSDFYSFVLENLEQKNNSSFSVQAFFVIVLSILKSEQKKVKTFKYKYYLNVESSTVWLDIQ